jgi:hypothetical protein
MVLLAKAEFLQFTDTQVQTVCWIEIRLVSRRRFVQFSFFAAQRLI